MEQFIQWISEHLGPLLASLVGLFVVIAKITPTPKDDKWAAKFLAWLNLLPVSAKQKLEEDKAAQKE